MPEQKQRSNKNLISFFINKNIPTDSNGMINPSGPLLKTAKAAKTKNNKIPIPFLSLKEYPVKSD